MNSTSGFSLKNARSNIFQHGLVKLLNYEFWSMADSTCGSEFLGCVMLAKLINLLCFSFLITTMEIIRDLSHGVLIMT